MTTNDNIKNQLTAHFEAYCKRRTERQETGDGNETSSLNTYTNYGTAGFRGNATKIEHLFYKLGLISALRCMKLNANIGVMVTASHNPIQDNGVKLIDSNGDMLESEWEPIVEHICNLHDKDKLINELYSLITRFDIDVSKTTIVGTVFIGCDTRPSSDALVALLKHGLNAWSPLINYVDFGLVTTPALHYLVAESNKTKFSQISLKVYYDKLINGLVDIFSQNKEQTSSGFYSSTQLVIDCANGVGYETLKNLNQNELFKTYFPVKLINIGDGILNHLCGADYVKSQQLPPSEANEVEKRYASLDGDADRVVYFYLEKGNNSDQGDKLKLNLIDGDKIMALYAIYLRDMLKRAKLEQKLSLGTVQTAYANGSSTDFLTTKLGLEVEFADTGVKNLHKKALKYDFGIYFEANGHGTIWISSKARSLVENGGHEVAELKQLMAILNNYTGDAISDILIVETILRHYDWDVKKWHQLYKERPSSLIKVQIKDRDCIKTTNAGQTCVEPADLQPEIDRIVKGFGLKSRCFVRPSGTENVVRIYAEADNQEAAESLANRVGERVKELCNN